MQRSAQGRPPAPIRTAGVPGTGLRGLYGRPYVDLEPYVDTAAFPALHDEICLGLAQTPVDYTGGSHRSMGIMPPSRADEVVRDYGEAIRALDDAAFATFRSLADDPASIDPARRPEFGEEREVPLSRRQMLWLKYRHGIYFPWKVYVELIPNRWWTDKADAAGKRFTRVATTLFPKTIAWVQRLPFASIGRCNIMGLEGHDHGTVHRDGDPAEQAAPDAFITFVPGPRKRLYLWDEARREKTEVAPRVYWFNDHDYHGVEADPWFRYSIRVDGVLQGEFVDRLRRDLGGDP
jgi:hypothetical protein